MAASQHFELNNDVGNEINEFGPKDLSSRHAVKKLTSGAAVGLFGEQFLDLLGKVALGAPDKAYRAENHEDSQ